MAEKELTNEEKGALMEHFLAENPQYLSKEDLCEELKRKVVDHGDFKMICHHFVHTIYMESGYENHQYNEMLRLKNENYLKHVEDGEIMHALGYVERPYRCDYACDLILDQNLLPPKKAAEVVAWIWTDSENIHQNKEGWLDLLLYVKGHPKEFMGEDDFKFFSELPEEITIYRGYNTDYEADDNLGFSWTLSKKQAEWFANRYTDGNSETAAIETRKVKKTDVIGYLNNRNEEEIVYIPY